MTTTTDVAALDTELNQMILEGKILEAFERFYAEDCVMQENTDEPRVGKAANRAYEEGFVGNIAEVHAVKLGKTGVGDGVSFSEWIFDITFKDGSKLDGDQVAVRQWRNGQVVHERFYYKGA